MGGADARAGGLFGRPRSGAEDAEKSAGHEAQGGSLAAPLFLLSPLFSGLQGSHARVRPDTPVPSVHSVGSLTFCTKHVF